MRKEIHVILAILVLLLFLTAHFLGAIYYFSEYLFLYIFVDISLYLGIILQLILIYEEVRK